MSDTNGSHWLDVSPNARGVHKRSIDINELAMQMEWNMQRLVQDDVGTTDEVGKVLLTTGDIWSIGTGCLPDTG